MNALPLREAETGTGPAAAPIHTQVMLDVAVNGFPVLTTVPVTFSLTAVFGATLSRRKAQQFGFVVEATGIAAPVGVPVVAPELTTVHFAVIVMGLTPLQVPQV